MATEDDRRSHELLRIARVLWPEASPDTIAETAKRLKRGLSAEDEISVILAWLGRCRLVHKLDQAQYPPDTEKAFRVPDLLAVFDYRGKNIPVLIEVKSSKETKLKWTSNYTGALRSYADMLGLPLLIAWKTATFWTLVDIAQFKLARTSHHLPQMVALRESLMCVLAGDFLFRLKAGTRINLKIEKLSQWDESGGEGKIAEVYFSNMAGSRLQEVPGAVHLFACFQDALFESEDDESVHQRFEIPDDGEGQFAHRTLEHLLQTFRSERFGGDWQRYLVTQQLPETLRDIRGTVEAMRASGYIEHVLRLRPKTMPEFLAV